MKKVLWLCIVALLTISVTACNTNDSQEEKDSEQKTSQKNNRGQFNMETVEVDPELEEVANMIMESNDIFGNSEDEEPQIIAMNEQRISLINEQVGSTLQKGITISSNNSNIAIYESSTPVEDIELLKNFEGFNRDNIPKNNETPRINERPESNERPETDENKQGLGNEEFENVRPNRDLLFNMEGSVTKLIGNYIVIADTDDNELVFSMCESQLK